jgi:diaminohydroxyphosphoribosylaminopyrimidine deaminase/5-amino-6-(5-phosphoribosylamino)uracil reductase
MDPSSHERFMKMALDLALKAKGRTSPNPLVGAVLVKEGKVIGTGYHQKAGMPHAEIEALKATGERARGADLYVNLEPCCTFGKTPPCCDALIKSGVKRVFAGMKDPNPLVSGKGFEILKGVGIETVGGILEEEARKTNEIFIKYITTKKPFVILKSAASLDGKTAAPSGESKWITGEEARGKVHEIRDEVDAVMVGVNTVIRDDPMLTARPKGREEKIPYRIVLDSALKIPENSRLLRDDAKKTIIATTNKCPMEKAASLEAIGAIVIRVEEEGGMVCLPALMKKLGEMEITSVLIEGGSRVNASALRSGIVDKVVFFYAPKIIGGADAFPMFGLEGARELKDAIRIKNMEVSRVGEDVMVVGYVFS